MRRNTKNILKICLLISSLSVFLYYFQLNKDVKLTTGNSNRNRPDIFDYYGPKHVDKVKFNPPEVKESNVDDGLIGKNSKPFDWEKRQPNSFQYPSFQSNDLGNYEEEPSEPKRAGAGEYGEEVKLDSSLKSAVDKSIGEFGFNIIASDRVSLDRAPKDLRHPECKHWDYPPQLAPVSVIMVFHNEAWSPLMRTVHNVINTTPKQYLHEVVLIDDGSQKEHLKDKLDEYIVRFNGLVKLYRNLRREGLIRARSIGAKKSTGQILVYLDAHCEGEPNWLAPLITPILNDHRACTVPLIDAIDGNKYTFTEQAGGDSDGFARGAWDWSLQWKRIPLTKKEKAHRNKLTEPYRSPAMAGGLFAIDRDFFFEIGLYDDGLEIWGGENFELSYKVWMCGGEVLFIPCSRVGHVYRLPGWHGNPPPSYIRPNAVLRNYRRVVDTWWDGYAKYFYMRRPSVKNVDPGDMTEIKAVRKRLQCRTFEWFMREIAYDIPAHYPLVEPPPGASGKIMNIGTKKCIDGKMGGSGSPVGLSDCDHGGSELTWWLTWHEDIRPGGRDPNEARQVCLDSVGRDLVVSFWECHMMHGNQLFKYIYDQKHLYHSVSRSCLEASPGEGKVFARECNDNNLNQLWTWDKLNVTQLALFNTKMDKAAFEIDV